MPVSAKSHVKSGALARWNIKHSYNTIQYDTTNMNGQKKKTVLWSQSLQKEPVKRYS
jgi:hypothetical protein